MVMTEPIKANRTYKDRLFRFLFNDKKELLSLYNAMNHTDYKDPEDITITTMENFIYMSMKNDVSFLISDVLNLYEHQSTWNPNMPYRNLLYLTDLLRGYVDENQFDIYGSRQILLPTPQVIVFYNGKTEVPERMMLKLSDSFQVKAEESCLECKTLVLNINYGQNRELMEKCRRLEEYAIFVDRVRIYEKEFSSLTEAINEAISECIAEGVLSEVLAKHRSEVLNMLLTEYDEQAHIANEKKWSYEDGFDDGKQIGFENGEKSGLNKGIMVFIEDKLEDGASRELIIERLMMRFALTQEQAEAYLTQVTKK